MSKSDQATPCPLPASGYRPLHSPTRPFPAIWIGVGLLLPASVQNGATLPCSHYLPRVQIRAAPLFSVYPDQSPPFPLFTPRPPCIWIRTGLFPAFAADGPGSGCTVPCGRVRFFRQPRVLPAAGPGTAHLALREKRLGTTVLGYQQIQVALFFL